MSLNMKVKETKKRGGLVETLITKWTNAGFILGLLGRFIHRPATAKDEVVILSRHGHLAIYTDSPVSIEDLDKMARILNVSKAKADSGAICAKGGAIYQVKA